MSKRILIAEDDGFMAKLITSKLLEDGFEVDTVINGKEASIKAKENDYSLILTDLIMPIMDGFQLLTELKKNDNKAPVFVFSNLTQSEDEKEVMNLGAKYFLPKITPLEELLVLIKRHVK